MDFILEAVIMTPQEFYQLQQEMKVIDNLKTSRDSYKRQMDLAYRFSNFMPAFKDMYLKEAKYYKKLYWTAAFHYEKAIKQSWSSKDPLNEAK